MEFEIIENALANLKPIERGLLKFTPVFGYGTKKDLMEHLRMERKEGGSYYPLVWMMTPFKTEGDYFISTRSTGQIKLILATLTNRDISNKERVRITFNGTLEPLLDDVVYNLRFGKQVGIVEGNVFEVEKFFGYDTDGSNATSDVWDAITLQCTIKLNYNC